MEKKERGLKRTVIGLYLAYYLVLIYAFYRNVGWLLHLYGCRTCGRKYKLYRTFCRRSVKDRALDGTG